MFVIKGRYRLHCLVFVHTTFEFQTEPQGPQTRRRFIHQNFDLLEEDRSVNSTPPVTVQVPIWTRGVGQLPICWILAIPGNRANRRVPLTGK